MGHGDGYKNTRSEPLVAAFVAQAEDLLEDIAVVGAAAGVGGRGAVEEGRAVVVGAGASVSRLVVLSRSTSLDAIRRGEGLGVGVLRQLHGFLHELGPDGARRRARLRS